MSTRTWHADKVDYPVTASLLAKRDYRQLRNLGASAKAARWKTEKLAARGVYTDRAARFAVR